MGIDTKTPNWRVDDVTPNYEQIIATLNAQLEQRDLEIAKMTRHIRRVDAERRQLRAALTACQERGA